MTELLDGQVAVITGAGRGLGRAYALALAHAGAKVVVNDRDGEPAHAVAAEIAAMGAHAVADVGSIASRAEAERAVRKAFDSFGRLDVMVTNAGADRRGPVLELAEEDYTATFAVHVYGTINCSIAGGRAMRDQGQGGCIINVTSGAFFQGTPHLSPYAASKGAIYGFMRTLHLELAPYGIAVNAVSPPLTITEPVLAYIDSLEAMGVPPLQQDAIRASAQQPVNVAPIVVFLASAGGRRHSGNVFTCTADALVRIAPPAESTVPLEGANRNEAVSTAVAKLLAG